MMAATAANLRTRRPPKSVFAGKPGNIANNTQSSNASRCLFRTRRSSYTCATSPPMIKIKEA